MDLVSVIVPVYNVEKYISECLDSIAEQSYTNLEIILVDDGSKDRSGELCDLYCKKDARFKVLHKKNEGLGFARNSGLELATGTYVTFVDSDDWIDRNLIKNMYDVIIYNKADFCKSGFQRITNKKKVLNKTEYENTIYKGKDVREKFLPRMLGSAPEMHDSVEMCVCAVMYKLDIIRKYQLTFPSERELISEDLVFNISYMQYADIGIVIDYIGYNYRFNTRSLTKSYRSDRFEAILHYYNAIQAILLNYGYGKKEKIRLQRMMFLYLRRCIAQEKRKISKHGCIDSLENISNICRNNNVQKIIEEYPVYKLGLKQRIFIFMLKRKMTVMLYILAELSII